MKMKNLDKKKFQLRLAYVSDYWNSSWIDDPEREKNLTQRIIDVKDNFSWCFFSIPRFSVNETYYKLVP